jgi:non-lysosomal glucosylceramidase
MRKCNCSGHCGPQPLNRREFIGLVSAGAAATLLGTPAWGAFDLPAGELQRWRRELFAPAKPRLYLSDKHTDARMHLGGIGTGNFEIGVDGQFTTWQLFNTLRDGEVPLHFLIRVGSTTRLLQTAGGPDWSRVQQIEMTGEYPVAVLGFRDTGLPVEAGMTVFSPFAPLDARVSSMPLAAFVFRIKNPTQHKQTVSLAAFMQNPVGYDAAGPNNSIANPCFVANVNEPLREGSAGGLFMRALTSVESRMDKAVTLYVSSNLKALDVPPSDRPHRLTVNILTTQPPQSDKLSDPAHTVLWLEEPVADTPEASLRAAQQAVQAGATLLLSGRSLPLLQAYASWTGGKPIAEASHRPDILFEDFEHGYDKWKLEGEAFGKEPAKGTLSGQQPVSGFFGQGLVNSFRHGDDTTGRLTSQRFTIERRFIRFLLGGGHHETTQIRLLVDGKVVCATSGKDNEQLLPVTWDVEAFQGHTAHIEIVDEQKGGWGHINVDQIEFTDMPGNRAVMQLLEELLPARFSRIRAVGDPSEGSKRVEFENLALLPGAVQSLASDGTPLLARPVGKGTVVVTAGPVLEPAAAGFSHQRQRAYAFVCALVGASYTTFGGCQHPKAPGFGTLALAALKGEITMLSSFANWNAAWKAFADEGRFAPLAGANSSTPSLSGYTVNGGVAATITVAPGQSVEVPFLLAWHYPNKYDAGRKWMGCHYAIQWPDAWAVVREAAKTFSGLQQRAELFRQTFYDSTLPYWLLDCLTANAAIVRHIGVVFQVAGGDVYGWEGSNGCCQPTCTHVWGYEQSLARLFPALERDMRRIDFTHQQRADGGVNNRTDVPSPPHPTGEQPFADGHASCILKAYREALNQPDDSFLQQYWPNIKRAVEYLISRDAKGAGGQPAGILQDDQWNTYDEALHGVTTFISGYYLAALRVGEEWARRVGDPAAAERFYGIFEQGQKKLVELCWNGEYFQQHLPDYAKRQGEVGPGCMSDQLIGQWWAHQLGLGYILPQDKIVSALRAVFKHNWKSDLTGWQHAPRAFAGANDKGLIICTWPKGGRPGNVMLYSDEVWTGIEYQVAAHLIYEGLVEEGFAIVKGARDRYDGIPRPPIARNPWNEIECGGHYARAMSSWSLLQALSGWEYDGPRQALRFTPRITPEHFKGFFVGPEGWGSLRQTREGAAQQNELSVREGRLAVAKVTLAAAAAPNRVKVESGGKTTPSTFSLQTGMVSVAFRRPAVVRAGQRLVVLLG